MWLRWWTRKLDTVPGMPGSNPSADKNFSFCNFWLFRVPRTWTYGRIQMKSNMTFIQGNRSIERER